MQASSFSVSGNLVDVWTQQIYPATILVENGIISSIHPNGQTINQAFSYILPGFIDSHVHIESSMLIPSEFAKLAVVHGTVATISDPHEIANVCGMQGVEFMIENGKQVPFKFYFGAPSCVPATTFETAGDALNSKDVEALLQKPEIKYLSEMMNFPGVLHGDEEVMLKIAAAKKQNKPVDGHAPGLRGTDARKYIEAGISTDHECFTSEEAEEKLKYGMHILIREGSAAKNFEALISLLNDYPDKIMFCSDDKHPDSLVAGHINQLCARAIAKGIDIFKVLKAACVNPVLHYKLEAGLLRVGDAADFIMAEDLQQFIISKTYINGALVAENGHSLIHTAPVEVINKFNCNEINEDAIRYAYKNQSIIPVIEALDGQLITNKIWMAPKVEMKNCISDTDNDLLKMVVVNRYNNAPVARAFVKNFGIKNGAIASSVAHDSHNIIAVGATDAAIVKAVNCIIQQQGGICFVNQETEQVLQLPIAGLMSGEDGYLVAKTYTALDALAKAAGSTLSAPFMTLSFMALLVIPHLKLSDKGLFDGDNFELI